MKPVSTSLRIIIPSILVFASLLFIAAAYLQINYNLKKEVVKTEINEIGTDITSTTLTGVFIVTNNLIWWVVARRRRDEIHENI